MHRKHGEYEPGNANAHCEPKPGYQFDFAVGGELSLRAYGWSGGSLMHTTSLNTPFQQLKPIHNADAIRALLDLVSGVGDIARRRTA